MKRRIRALSVWAAGLVATIGFVMLFSNLRGSVGGLGTVLWGLTLMYGSLACTDYSTFVEDPAAFARSHLIALVGGAIGCLGFVMIGVTWPVEATRVQTVLLSVVGLGYVLIWGDAVFTKRKREQR
jgi:hypothetical protein